MFDFYGNQLQQTTKEVSAAEASPKAAGSSCSEGACAVSDSAFDAAFLNAQTFVDDVLTKFQLLSEKEELPGGQRASEVLTVLREAKAVIEDKVPHASQKFFTSKKIMLAGDHIDEVRQAAAKPRNPHPRGRVPPPLRASALMRRKPAPGATGAA